MKDKDRVLSFRFVWFVWMALMCAAAVTALPGAARADERTGSVRFQLPAQETTVELSLVAVGTYSSSEGYVWGFEGVTLDDLGDAAQSQKAAEDLKAIVAEFDSVKNASAGENVGTVSAGGQVLGIGKEGTVLTGRADDEGLLTFKELAPGMYLALQTAGEEQCVIQPVLVPLPYLGAGGEGLYEADLAPKYSIPGGAVILSKVDEEGNPVAGAEFILQEKVYLEEGEEAPEGAEKGSDSDGANYWKEYTKEKSSSIESGETATGTMPTNGSGQIAIRDVPQGTYRFVETKAPAGFIMNGDMPEFTISASGQVVSQSAKYVPASGKVEQVTATNTQTKVTVNKVDEKGEALAGAVLTIKDADKNTISTRDESGNEVLTYMFESAKTATVLKRLPVGKYFLSELQAPEGYDIAEDVPFEVTDSPEGVQVTMTDPKKKETPVSLSVTKKLYTYTVTLDREALQLYNGTFYVALFNDEEGTDRCSEVQALVFTGQQAQTATFTDLEKDKTYYIFETDEAGNPHKKAVSWKNEAGNTYTAVYPNGQSIKAEAGKDNRIEFENEFTLKPLDGNIVNETEKPTEKPAGNKTDNPKKEKPTEARPPLSGGAEGPEGGGGGTTGGSTGNVRTGDNTRIALTVGILCGAALLIIILVVILLRRRKKK